MAKAAAAPHPTQGTRPDPTRPDPTGRRYHPNPTERDGAERRTRGQLSPPHQATTAERINKPRPPPPAPAPAPFPSLLLLLLLAFFSLRPTTGQWPPPPHQAAFLLLLFARTPRRRGRGEPEGRRRSTRRPVSVRAIVILRTRGSALPASFPRVDGRSGEALPASPNGQPVAFASASKISNALTILKEATVCRAL